MSYEMKAGEVYLYSEPRYFAIVQQSGKAGFAKGTLIDFAGTYNKAVIYFMTDVTERPMIFNPLTEEDTDG